MNQLRLLHIFAATSLIALIVLCLGWELWWAPLRPGGSLLVLKTLPLLLPLFGILRSKRYTYQWTSMFILIYLMEGLVRSTSEHGASRALAAAEAILALIFFVSVVAYSRLTRQLLQQKT
jgi:uncharacterized membrane protein